MPLLTNLSINTTTFMKIFCGYKPLKKG